MRAVVVAGSNLASDLDVTLLTATDLLVAVDGGADALARVGLVPALLVGDMDSISAETREALEARGVEVVLLRTAKDEADLEAALRLVVDRGADDITVYGALGGPRLLLASPWLVAVRVRLVDDWHEALMVKGDVTVAGERDDIVSLMPLTPQVEAVRTEGLLYPLAGEQLLQSATRGVSNVMTGVEARVTHGSGALLLIHYRGR
jgi:thiamine pyrophosphokinase